MDNSVKIYRTIEDPFFMESIEPGTDTSKLEYHGRGEDVYADGRQVLVRSCHDALVSCNNKHGERGIILIRRRGEPARGYLWPFGGFYDRGIPTATSLASRIKQESGLDIDENSLTILGMIRAMWKTTANKKAQEKGLPLGIDDTGVLFYGAGHGNLSLDYLHERPLIVTPDEYTLDFRESLHPYVREGMNRAIKLL